MGADRAPERRAGGVDAGALLEDRDYVKVTTGSLSAALIRQVLLAMDERRRTRRLGPERSGPLPEMSVAEMQREIAWRLVTLPPEDARAIASLVRHLATNSQ